MPSAAKSDEYGLSDAWNALPEDCRVLLELVFSVCTREIELNGTRSQYSDVRIQINLV